MKILGIETSCDETGAAIIEGTSIEKKVALIGNVLASSLIKHEETGGVIPEVAAREQLKLILPVIEELLEKTGETNNTIDAIGVTVGPGLIGSLLIGVETAKTLAYVWNKPLIPVNHLYGHIYANWISKNDDPEIIFPAIALIVSGGHTDLMFMKSHKDTTWLGGTRDDAAGECFDKCARLLGHSYPGGPKISALGELGNPEIFKFPRPMLDSHDYDFSFSGLKTAFLYETREHFPILRTTNLKSKGVWDQIGIENELSKKDKQTLYDLCASLEQAIIDTIVTKTIRAVKEYEVKTLIISGGVSANKKLTERFINECRRLNICFSVPTPLLCTDNAAMIAAAAFYQNSQIPWKDVRTNPQLYFD
jgi:N6-L-threonylcarbamoyladenine synthase